jgi:hypothetical protein
MNEMFLILLVIEVARNMALRKRVGSSGDISVRGLHHCANLDGKHKNEKRGATTL